MKKKEKKLVVMDIDGVLADFEGRLVQHLVMRFGDEAIADRSFYSLERRYNSKNPEVIGEAIRFVNDPNSYYSLEEHDGAIQFVETLMVHGHKILYLSSRPKNAYMFTRRWLSKKISDMFLNLFTGIEDKAHFLSDLGESVEFVVEDSPVQIKELKEAGFTVACWSQPWNEGIFPRFYVRTDGVVMLWGSDDTEAEPFFSQERV